MKEFNEVLKDLISRGMVLNMARHLNGLSVMVTKIDAGKKFYKCEQVIPVDHHLNKLADVVKYCYDNVVNQQKEYEQQSR